MGNPMETTDYIILIGNTIYTYIHLWESVEYVLRGDMQWGEILFKDAFLPEFWDSKKLWYAKFAQVRLF